MEKAISERPDDTLILYNAACTYAILNRKKETLELLRSAKEKGFANYDWWRQDSDLVFLHGDPEFELLLKKE